MAEHLFSVGDVQLACHVAGEGTPVVLIHGFPFDHAMWQAQIDVLAATCKVIASDLRGFGRSTLGPTDAAEGVGMETYAEDIAAVLDELQVDEPAIMCGFSMGGYILWQFVQKYPERVRALVLCDTRAVADSEEASAGRLAMADDIESIGAAGVAEGMLPKVLAAETIQTRPEMAESVAGMMRRMSTDAIAAAQRGMARRPDVRSELGKFDWPSLVLVGSEDAISSPDEMREIAEQLPQAEFVEIPGAGHMSPIENAEAFNGALSDFVAAHLGS